jgi:hypothetical protein
MCTFLLHYCASDLNVENIGDCQQLHLLPILPLKSGATGIIQVFTPQQADAVASVCSMGFSVSRALWALSRSGFRVPHALELLATSPEAPSATTAAATALATHRSMGNHSGSAATPTRTSTSSATGTHQTVEQEFAFADTQDGIFILAGDDIGSVFAGAADILVDTSKIQSTELDFLAHRNIVKLSNVRPFQAALVVDLLRHILPLVCFANVPVEVPFTLRKPSISGQEVESNNDLGSFITSFWKFVASKPDVISAVAEGAAIVPTIRLLPSSATDSEKPSAVNAAASSSIQERNNNTGTSDSSSSSSHVLYLCPLSRLSALLIAERGEDLVISTGIQRILQVFGVRLVDVGMLGLSDSGVMAKAFWQYVQSPSRA